MEKQITIIVPIHCKPEYQQVIREQLIDLVAKTQQEPGNICYSLHEVPADPNQFIIYEKWQNQAALDFHMEQDYLKRFLESSKTLLAQDIKGTICKEIG